MGISFTKELGAVLLLLWPSVMLEDVVVVVTVVAVVLEVVMAGISFSVATTFDGVGVDGVVGGAVVEEETIDAVEGGGGGCSVIVVVFYKMLLGRNRNAKNQSTNSKRLCR